MVLGVETVTVGRTSITSLADQKKFFIQLHVDQSSQFCWAILCLKSYSTWRPFLLVVPKVCFLEVQQSMSQHSPKNDTDQLKWLFEPGLSKNDAMFILFWYWMINFFEAEESPLVTPLGVGIQAGLAAGGRWGPLGCRMPAAPRFAGAPTKGSRKTSVWFCQQKDILAKVFTLQSYESKQTILLAWWALQVSVTPQEWLALDALKALTNQIRQAT